LEAWSCKSTKSAIHDHAFGHFGRRRRCIGPGIWARAHVVHTFGSAGELLESPHLNDTSCVIADLQMSAMNGLEVLVEMRMQGYAAPFIFITAFPGEGVCAQALNAGATCFPTKPCAMANLIACRDAALVSGVGT
jgi:FixJ family two-component response regulator